MQPLSASATAPSSKHFTPGSSCWNTVRMARVWSATNPLREPSVAPRACCRRCRPAGGRAEPESQLSRQVLKRRGDRRGSERDYDGWPGTFTYSGNAADIFNASIAARAEGASHTIFIPIFIPGAAMTPRVLIVDDEVDSCWLVAFVLRRDPNLALAGEATDGEMALSLVRQERPDVVVTDIKMPRLDGLEATRRIKREWPDTKVLVLTHLTDDHTRREAFEKGADAFLNKRDMASALVPAIWDACGARRPRSARSL